MACAAKALGLVWPDLATSHGAARQPCLNQLVSRSRPQTGSMIGARKEMAQKPHEPTDKSRLQAQSAAGLGLPHDQIGALLGISDETLRKYYPTELALGKAQSSAAVAETLYNKAQAGDTTAMIWWTKAQMRWAETVRHTGHDEGPVQLVVRWQSD